MRRPEMILFDYGGTLLCEPGFDAAACERAAFPYITANPLGLDAARIYEHVQRLFREFQRHLGEWSELHEWQFLRLAYESLGLEFSLSWAELEEIEWNAASPGAAMPHAEEMLDALNARGIRTGVISNINWSGAALTRRLDRLLPRNRFEFVLASSEYGVRKPNPLLFQVALARARLSPEQVWFCGDHPENDVRGATRAGLFPVYYAPGSGAPTPGNDCLTIRDWRELVEKIDAPEDSRE